MSPMKIPKLSDEEMRFIREKLSQKHQQIKMPTSNMTPLNMAQISMSPLVGAAEGSASMMASQVSPRQGQSQTTNFSKQ